MKSLNDFPKETPLIDRFIQIEALKLAERYNNYHNFLHIEHQRKSRRLLEMPPKKVKIPESWDQDKKFNPYYVLSHHKQISKSIQKKIADGSYSPNPPFKKSIPKGNNKFRTVLTYQIPDAAVSSYLYYRLLSKNKHRFSYHAYAYRNDKNVHYAIQDISLELKTRPRLFVAEYDFSDFFGSISHDYLFKQMDENGFIITNNERKIIKAFLHDPESDSKKGIPQGTSISLFLANLVCWKLDRQLELEGVRFARYADDTIIWSEDYSKICNAFNTICEFSENSEVPINYAKSNGISLLADVNTPSELQNAKDSVEFLGYRLSRDKVSIKNSASIRIKNKISYILHQNLTQPLLNNLENANPEMLPESGRDKALLVAICQIRRYLYGDLTDEKIARYLNNTYKKLDFKGLMCFYPLVDDDKQLRQLDGWLVHTIMRYLKRRYKILEENGRPFDAVPLSNKPDFISYCKHQVVDGKKGLMQIPSFILIFKAVKKSVNTQGIMTIVNPFNDNYNYDHTL